MKDAMRPVSRRERQILDVLHRRGAASAAEVQEALDDAPSYSAIRALLRVMEEKELVTHTENGRTYVYRPAVSARTARRNALRHVVSTFFGGSVEEAAAALLDLPDTTLDPAARRRLERRIASARREGR